MCMCGVVRKDGDEVGLEELVLFSMRGGKE